MNTDENLKGHDTVAREVTSRMENISQGEKKGVFFTLFSCRIKWESFSRTQDLKFPAKRRVELVSETTASPIHKGGTMMLLFSHLLLTLSV